MHPILSHRNRVLGYLASWLPIGLLIAALLGTVGELAWPLAITLGMPLAIVYAFICLAAWYPCRSVPLAPTHLWRALASHSLAAVMSSGIWQLFGAAWAFIVSQVPFRSFEAASEEFSRSVSLFFFVGLLIYTLAAAASYLLISFESSRIAERRALEATKRQELAAQELALARELQQRLLPAGDYNDYGVRIAARTIPARYVGGDFYDYFRLADGSFRIAVGDVAGKGTAASLVMATVKAMLPLLAAQRSVEETMLVLNQKLCRELAPREFVALALASFDPPTGRLELVNAGIPDPYLLRQGAKPNAIEAPLPRLPLGLKPDLEYTSVSLVFSPGDRFFFCSDGVPESQDASGELLGYEELEGVLAFWSPDPREWLDDLVERLQLRLTEEISDDWTMLILAPDASS